MSVGYCENTIYIATDDVPAIGAAIVEMVAREGMQAIAVELPDPRGLDAGIWAVTVFPGAPGWAIVKSGPQDLLFELSPISRRMRFLDLCDRLGTRGFIWELYGGYEGQLIVESDGAGNHLASGHHWDGGYDCDPFDFYGTPLDRERAHSLQFELLPELAPLLVRGEDYAFAPYQTDHEAERLSYYFAQELAGANARYCKDAEAWGHLRGSALHDIPGAVTQYFRPSVQARHD